MTLQDYFKTPETVLPQELIYGDVRVADAPTPRHQQAVGALFLALHAHVRRGGLGDVWLAPLDVVLDADRALVVQPDLFVIMNNGVAVVRDHVHGPPDLVIEVLSPRPRIGDVIERVGWFREHGVRECWLVHQIERQTEVLEFANGQVAARRIYEEHETIKSGVLPRFEGSLASILAY